MGANRVLNAIRRRVFGSREEEPPDLQLLVSLPKPEQQQHVEIYLSNHDEPFRLPYRPEQTVRVS
jgi:hypothetical protein